MCRKDGHGTVRFDPETDITDLDVTRVRNQGSQTEMAEALDARMEAVRASLPDWVKKFTIAMMPDVLVIGSCPVGLVLEEFLIMAVTDSGSGLFDTGIVTGGPLVHWNKRADGPMVHSGDINGSGVLLHTMGFASRPEDAVFGVMLSAYQGKTLGDHAAKRPFVVVVDRERETLWIVPLDLTAIGSSRTALPLVMRVKDGVVTLKLVTPSCGMIEIQNSGAVNDPMRVTLTTTRFPERAAPPAPVPTAPASNATAAPTAQALPAPSASKAAACAEGPMLVVERKLFDRVPNKLWAFNHAVVFQQDAIKVELEDGKPPRVPPLGNKAVSWLNLDETAEGGPAVALGGRCKRPHKGFLDMFRGFCVAYVSDNMLPEFPNTSSKHRLQAVMVIDVGVVPGADVRKRLVELNQKPAVALLTSTSTVFARVGDEYLYLRGVPIPGVMDTCDFGKPVPDFVKKIMALAECVDPRRSAVMDEDALGIVFLGKEYDPEAFCRWCGEASTDDLLTHQNAICGVLEQMKAKLDDSQLKGVAKAMEAVLRQHLKRSAEPAAKTVEDVFALAANATTATNASASKASHRERKGRRTVMRKKLEKLLNTLGRLISIKNALTEKFSLAKQAKKAAVAGNVKKAGGLTIEAFDEQIADKYANSGFLPVLLSGIADVLPRLRDETFTLKALQGMTGLHPRLTCALDSDTIMAFMHFAQEGRMGTHPLALLEGSKALSTIWPASHAGELQEVSMTAVPLKDDLVEVQDPFSIMWTQRVDEPAIALLRILRRTQLAKNRTTRGSPIHGGSRYLTWLLAGIDMAAIDRFAASRTEPVVPGRDWNDTFCCVMRGLFADLLLVLASGQTPVTKMWTLVSPLRPEVPATPDDWRIVDLFVRHWDKTAWPRRPMHRQLFKLLVRVVRSKVTRFVTDLLQTEKKKKKKNVGKEQMQRIMELNDGYMPARQKLARYLKGKLELSKTELAEIQSVLESGVKTNGMTVRALLAALKNKKLAGSEHTKRCIELASHRFRNRWKNLRRALYLRCCNKDTTDEALLKFVATKLREIRDLAAEARIAALLAEAEETGAEETDAERVPKTPSFVAWRQKLDAATVDLPDRVRAALTKSPDHLLFEKDVAPLEAAVSGLLRLEKGVECRRQVARALYAKNPSCKPRLVKGQAAVKLAARFGIEGVEADSTIIRGWEKWRMSPNVHKVVQAATAAPTNSTAAGAGPGPGTKDKAEPLDPAFDVIQKVLELSPLFDTTTRLLEIQDFLNDPSPETLGPLIRRATDGGDAADGDDESGLKRQVFLRMLARVLGVENMWGHLREVLLSSIRSWALGGDAAEQMALSAFEDSVTETAIEA